MVAKIINLLGFGLKRLTMVLLATGICLAQVPIGTPISNAGQFSYRNLGGHVFTGSSDTVVTEVAAGYSLQITKTADGSVVIPGDTVAYHINLSNTGNIDAGTITITDSLSQYLDYLSSNPAAVVSAGVVTWDLPAVPAGATVSIDLWCLLKANVPWGTQIPNTTWFATPEGVSGQSESILVEAGLAPALAFIKTVNEAVAFPGDTLKYNLIAHNSGNVPTTNTVVRDDLPGHMTFITASGAGSENLGIVTWYLGTLMPGEHDTLTLDVGIDPDFPSNSTLVNVASISNSEGITGSGTAATEILAIGNPLTFTKSVDLAVAAAGDTLRYILQTQNTGVVTSVNTIIHDDLPSSTTFISATGGGNETQGIVTWQAGNLLVGEEVIDTLLVKINPDVPPNTSLANVAYVTNSAAVLQYANVSTFINPTEMDVIITKDVDLDNAVIGDTLEYVVHAQNIGQIPSYSTFIHDFLPDYTTFISATGGGYENLGIVTWNVDTLLPGREVFDTLLVRIEPDVPLDFTLINVMQLTNAGGLHEYASATTQISEVDQPIQITKSAEFSSYGADDTVSYQLVLENLVAIDLQDIVVTDTLPEMLEFVSASDDGILSGNVVTWEIPSMAPFSLDTLSLKTSIIAPIVNNTEIINSVYVTSSNAGNSHDDYTISVHSLPEFSLSKSTAINVIPGDTLEYKFVYSNVGTAIGTQVNLIDTLSSDLQFIEASGSYTYDSDQRIVIWDLGDVLIAGPQELYLSARVVPSIPNGNQIINSATIISAEEVSATASTLTTTLLPILTIVDIPDSVLVGPGSLLGHTIIFENVGDTLATGVFITDTLSQDVTYDSSSGNSIYFPESHTVKWTIEDLPPGSMRTFRTARSEDIEVINENRTYSSGDEYLFVRVGSPLTNNTMLTNRVMIECSEGVQASSGSTVNVISQPVLHISKMAIPNALLGDTLDYTIRYSNHGNEVATQVTVTDTLPADLQFVTASDGYDYNAQGHLVTWHLEDLPPDTSLEQELQLSARVISSSPEDNDILNIASISSGQGAENVGQTITTVSPFLISVDAEPEYIIGNGADSSLITATVTDLSGNPVPDGIPVTFTTTAGSFKNGVDIVPTQNGFASTLLISDIVTQETAYAAIEAAAGFPGSGHLSDTTHVLFYAGAIEGTVYDYSGNPIPDAVVALIDPSTGATLSTFITGPNGYYLIPASGSGDYIVIITISDEYGNTIIVEQLISIEIPSSGGNEPIPNHNSISGTLFDQKTQEPILESGIIVILSGSPDSTTLGKASQESFRDTSITDSTGIFSFTHLNPGIYLLEVIYQGLHSYSDGSLDVDLSIPGQFIVGADIQLQQGLIYCYKTVDLDRAEVGDTLTYTLTYGSVEGLVSDTVFIVDNLPSELTLLDGPLLTNPSLQFDTYDLSTNEIRFHRPGIQIAEPDSIIFRALVKSDIEVGIMSIENTAFAYTERDTASSTRDIRSNAQTELIVPFLALKKVVNHKVAEWGDILTYTITLENKSNELPLDQLVINDFLPVGFKYKARKSFWDSEKIDDPVHDVSDNSNMHLTWTIDDTLNPGESRQLKYRVVVGLTSRYGENDNTAIASAKTIENISVTSRVDEATVVIRPGIFDDRGLIFGKVYYDENDNNVHDGGEQTAKSIELITENGIRVTSDKFGKFSIPNLKAGTHVLRLNENSLPSNTKIKLNSADFLGDPSSRLVELSPGGIAKANFALERFALEQEKVVTIAMRKIAHIDMVKEAVTDEFRLLNYKPWSMYIRIGFLSGEATLRPEIYSALRKVTDFLQWQGHINLKINGHTDNDPLPPNLQYKDNLSLSKARAESIESFLVEEMEIDSSRIISKGYGDTEPIASNLTVDGRAANRRVELVFHAPEENREQFTTLKFKYGIGYSGEIELGNVRFHEILPEGYAFAEGSALFDGIPYQPAYVSEEEVIWDFGTRLGESAHSFQFGLNPLDLSQLKYKSISMNYVEFIHPDGTVEYTDSLITIFSSLVEELSFKLTMKGAIFDVGSARLKDEGITSLRKVGEFMEWQPDIKVLIEGFTDDTGPIEENIRLSRMRAESVKKYLINNFPIDRENIEARGMGPNFPVADNNTKAGQAKNRRVEILVNSSIGQEVTFVVEAAAESFQHQIQSPKDPSDISLLEGGITLIADASSSLQLNLNNLDPKVMDRVDVSIVTPDEILIRDVTGLESPVNTKTWQLLLEPDQTELSLDFNVLVAPDAKGEKTMQLLLQPYWQNIETPNVIERTVLIRVD